VNESDTNEVMTTLFNTIQDTTKIHDSFKYNCPV